MSTKKRIHQMSVVQWEAAFPDEAHCAAYLVKMRWPDGAVVCPRCGCAEKISAVSTMENRWQCYACSPDSGYRFSHIAGTIFENTNKPLRDWFRVIHLMLTSKKGMSALQIMRYMGFGSYKTAHYMCHRIRAALVDNNPDQLGGVVEVDETFVGGLVRNKHWDKRGPGGRGGTGSGKTPVAGAVRRKGGVVARVIENVRVPTLVKFVEETVSTKVSLVCIDSYVAYRSLGKKYPHGVINHEAGQYVVGAIHTNTIEGFWSILKRGIMGSYHKVSKKYLPLYVAEFEFRYNNRENDDIFGEAIRQC